MITPNNSLYTFASIASLTVSQLVTAQSVTTTSTVNQSTQPSTVACEHEPCTASVVSNNGLPNPHIHPLVPPTDDQLLERRLLNVFGEIAGEERYADETEKSGDTKTAAAIRGRFARMSGFSSTDAERIREIGSQYCVDIQAQHDQEIATVRAVKHANPGVRMSRLNSPEIADIQQKRKTLFDNLKRDLILALGPKGFTKLDSYSRHMYDNARTLTTNQMTSSK